MSRELALEVKARASPSAIPPLSEAAVADAEASLGFMLPTLLREMYLLVGNGRFGPGYGLLSLTNIGDAEMSAVDLYLSESRCSPDVLTWKWPQGVLAFCDWGCNVYSCVDCLQAPNAVSTYEFVSESAAASFMPTCDSLSAWFRNWLDGKPVFEPVYEHAPEHDRLAKNPISGAPIVIKARRPRRR